MQDDQNKTNTLSPNTVDPPPPPLPAAPVTDDVPPPPPSGPMPAIPDIADIPPPPSGVTSTDKPPPDSTPPAGGLPVITTSGGKPKGRFGGRMGKKGKVIATILGLLFLVGSVGAGVLLVQRNQDVREKAGVTYNITDKVTITQSHINTCFNTKCTDPGSCGVMVSHFKCDSNNLPGGCQQNGVIKTYAASAGSTWGFTTSRTCGTQQIDYGCRDLNGTYGSLGWLSYIGSNSCGGGAKCSDDSDSACVDKDPRDSCGNNKECKKDGSNTGSDGKPICKCRNISTPPPPTEPPPTEPPSTPDCDVDLRPDEKTINVGSTWDFTAYVTNVKNGTVGRVKFTVESGNPDRLSVSPGHVNDPPYITTATAINPGSPRIIAEVYMGGEPRCNDTSYITIPNPPTAPPIIAQCLEVKAFDTEFNRLRVADLAALSAGDSVIFTVAATATSGTFTGARFTINGVVRPVVTDKRPETEEFMDTYTIPEGTTDFSVKGEVRHSTIGWF